MKIAIAIYNNDVSNVFDFSRKVLVVDVAEGLEVNRREVDLESQRVMQRVGQLQRLEVEVLICGAVSRVLADVIEESGIKIISYVAGNVNDILAAYLRDELSAEEFSMPVCRLRGKNGCGNGRGGRGCGRGRQLRRGRCL